MTWPVPIRWPPLGLRCNYLGGLLPLPPPDGLPVVLGAFTGRPPLGGLLPLPPPDGFPVVLGALTGRPPPPPLLPLLPPLLIAELLWCEDQRTTRSPSQRAETGASVLGNPREIGEVAGPSKMKKT